nr:hypothetical protein [Tanacetum cinerariifolium]
ALVDDRSKGSPWLKELIDVDINMQHVPKSFLVDDVLFVVQFESDGMLMNINDGPEFLHVDFWYICSNKERLEEGTTAQYIIDDLQSGFLGLNVLW